MEIAGKIILALPEQSGVSKAGNAWKKREYVLELSLIHISEPTRPY